MKKSELIHIVNQIIESNLYHIDIPINDSNTITIHYETVGHKIYVHFDYYHIRIIDANHKIYSTDGEIITYTYLI